jgi:hypothetical protein
MCAKLYTEALFLPSVPGSRVRNTRYSSAGLQLEAILGTRIEFHAFVCWLAHRPISNGWADRTLGHLTYQPVES